ncbi:hypothetical protein V8F33_007525 [Rhypophila sp. PSN 637]
MLWSVSIVLPPLLGSEFRKFLVEESKFPKHYWPSQSRQEKVQKCFSSSTLILRGLLQELKISRYKRPILDWKLWALLLLLFYPYSTSLSFSNKPISSTYPVLGPFNLILLPHLKASNQESRKIYEIPVNRSELPERAEGPKKQRVEAEAKAAEPAEDGGQIGQGPGDSRGKAITWSSLHRAAPSQNDAHPSTEREGLHEYVAPAPVPTLVEAQPPARPPPRRILKVWLDWIRGGAVDWQSRPETPLPPQSTSVAERGPGELSGDQSRRNGGPPQALDTSSLVVMDAEPARPSLAIDGPPAAVDGPPLPVPLPAPNQPLRVSTPVRRHHDLIFDDEEASDPDSGPHYINECKKLVARLYEEYGPRSGQRDQFDMSSGDGSVMISSTPGKVLECYGCKVKLWAQLENPGPDRCVQIYGKPQLKKWLERLAESGASYPMSSDGICWAFRATDHEDSDSEINSLGSRGCISPFGRINKNKDCAPSTPSRTKPRTAVAAAPPRQIARITNNTLFYTIPVQEFGKKTGTKNRRLVVPLPVSINDTNPVTGSRPPHHISLEITSAQKSLNNFYFQLLTAQIVHAFLDGSKLWCHENPSSYNMKVAERRRFHLKLLTDSLLPLYIAWNLLYIDLGRVLGVKSPYNLEEVEVVPPQPAVLTNPSTPTRDTRRRGAAECYPEADDPKATGCYREATPGTTGYTGPKGEDRCPP